MDQTFLLIKIVYSYYFQIRPIALIKIANFQQVSEFGALKGFSDSLAALENHWETSPEEVTRQKAKLFVGPASEKREKARLGTDDQYGNQSSTKITRVHCSTKRISLKSILYYRR